MGENATFVGAEETLLHRGVEIVDMNSKICIDLMGQFISKHPDIWNEDIGR